MNKSMVFLYTLCLVGFLHSCAAKKWLALHLVRGPQSATSPLPTLSTKAKPVMTCSPKSNDEAATDIDCRNQSSTDAIIKGVPSDCRIKKTTVPLCPSKTTQQLCRTTAAEVCRFTLPPAPRTRKFLIGAHQAGKFCMKIHNHPPNGRECCHPGGGRPKIPDDFDEELPTHSDDPLYQKALSGELAEKIVDEIFKKSAKEGNPVIDPFTSDIQLKELSKTLENSMLEREGCCYKLSGELKCFLALLLLQRPTRRRRSCDCSDFDDTTGSKLPINGPSVNLPFGIFGFQAPPLMELP